MIPLGILAAQARAEGPGVPTEVAQVQEWPVATSSTPATGPAVTAGNLAIVRAIHRAMANGLPATITDNGGNVWHPLGRPDDDTGPYRGVVAGGSGDVYMWYAENVLPFTQATVVINGNTATARTLFVAEWAGLAQVGALIDDKGLANPSNRTPAPALVDVLEAGALVTGTLGATVSNRTFGLKTPGYVAGREHRANQTTLISAARAGVPAGTHGPSWEIPSNETASTSGSITAAFRPAA